MIDAEQKAGEHLIALTDEHWVKYIAPAVIACALFAISFALFIAAGASAYHSTWISRVSFVSASLLFFVTLHWFFMMLLSESLDRIIITNRRLIRVQYRLIFDEDILEISFQKTKTVDARKHGVLQNLLHYGTLHFETKLATINNVPHPNRIAKVIQEAMLSR